MINSATCHIENEFCGLAKHNLSICTKHRAAFSVSKKDSSNKQNTDAGYTQ